MSPESMKDLVIEAISKSKCSHGDRERLLHDLLARPEKDLVTLDEFHAGISNLSPRQYVVWFITRLDPQSVFFDENTGQFGSCWGPEKETGQYTDLGYRSKDPVEMYLV